MVSVVHRSVRHGRNIVNLALIVSLFIGFFLVVVFMFQENWTKQDSTQALKMLKYFESVPYYAVPNKHQNEELFNEASVNYPTLEEVYKYNLLDRKANWQLKMSADHAECTLGIF